MSREKRDEAFDGVGVDGYELGYLAGYKLGFARAIKEMRAAMPNPETTLAYHEFGTGWNKCRDEMTERLDRLEKP